MNDARLKLDRLLNENHGYLRTKDLPNYGLNRKQLALFVKDGTVCPIKRGLYKIELPDVTPFESFVDACRSIPQGVVCLSSALAYYDLSTINPGEVHLAIENRTRVGLPDYPPVRLHYFSQKQHEAGILQAEHSRGTFRIYSVEKTICDMIRLRSLTGVDLAVESLKSYLKRKDRNLERLLLYGKLGRVEKLLRSYLAVML